MAGLGFAVHRVARLAITLGAIGVLCGWVDTGKGGRAQPATFRVYQLAHVVYELTELCGIVAERARRVEELGSVRVIAHVLIPRAVELVTHLVSIQ